MEDAIQLLVSVVNLVKKDKKYDNVLRVALSISAGLSDALIHKCAGNNSTFITKMKSLSADVKTISEMLGKDAIYTGYMVMLGEKKNEKLSGKINSKKMVICGEKCIVGYKTKCLYAKCRVLAREIEGCDMDMIAEIADALIPADKRKDLMKSPIRVITEQFGYSQLFDDQMERYNYLRKSMEAYFAGQIEKYHIDTERPKKIVGGGTALAECSLLDDIDRKSLSSLLTNKIVSLSEISSQKEFMEAVANVGTAEDLFDYRKSVKEKIRNLEDVVNAEQNFDEPKITGSYKSDRDFVIFFCDLIDKIIPQLEEAEQKYVSLAAAMSDLIEIWKYLMGPTTDTCILHRYSPLCAVVSADILTALYEVRFGDAPMAVDLIDEKSRIEKKYNIPPMSYYDGGYIWDNVDKLSTL